MHRRAKPYYGATWNVLDFVKVKTKNKGKTKQQTTSTGIEKRILVLLLPNTSYVPLTGNGSGRYDVLQSPVTGATSFLCKCNNNNLLIPHSLCPECCVQ